MTGDSAMGTQTSVAPDEAFAILANDTRIDILQALGEADAPVHFTELREQVGLDQGRQFNYHLKKLVGHYVAKPDQGYTLRPPGSRVVQAIRSGAVTDHPVIDPTVLEEACHHCGAPMMLKYGGRLAAFCTQCSGNHQLPMPDALDQSPMDIQGDRIGFLAGYELPPAGIQGRSHSDALRAGTAWSNLEFLAIGVDVCPRCSAQIDASIQVCDSHDWGAGACAACGNRHAVIHTHACSTCNYERRTQFARVLLAHPDLLHFITGHDINPIAPEDPMSLMALLDDYEEQIVSTDPFRGRFTFTVDDDAITLTVNEELSVVDSTRKSGDRSAR